MISFADKENHIKNVKADICVVYAEISIYSLLSLRVQRYAIIVQ